MASRPLSHSQLNPRVKPFPGYLPDPIAPPSPPSQVDSSPPLTSSQITTATSTSSSGTGAGSGISTRTSTHTSTPFPYSVLQPPETKVQPVKEFGYGWSSSTVKPQASQAPQGNRVGPTSTSVSITEPAPDPLILPSRARSPSAPTLPSETFSGLGNGNNVETGYDIHRPSLDHVLSRKLSTGRYAFPTTNHTPNRAGLIPRRLPYQASLNHYPSVPSLINEYDHTQDHHQERERGLGYTLFPPAPPPPSSLSTKYSSPTVNRWRHGVLGDPVEEEGDELVFGPPTALTHTSTDTNSTSPTLTSPRSFPVLAQAMKPPTIAPEYTQSRNSMSPPFPSFPLSTGSWSLGTVYMSSVPAHTTEKQIHDEASQYGEILSLKLDRATMAGSRAFVM